MALAQVSLLRGKGCLQCWFDFNFSAFTGNDAAIDSDTAASTLAQFQISLKIKRRGGEGTGLGLP